MMLSTLCRRQTFLDGVPMPLVIARLLGLRPFGGEAGLERLPTSRHGPRLMWGEAWFRPNLAPRALRMRVVGRLARWAGVFGALSLLVGLWLAAPLLAQDAPIPGLPDSIVRRAETPEDVTSTIELLLLLTVLTLAPSILIMTTAFTRIIIVFGFLRLALSTQQLPPSQVLIGLSLILTFLVMKPTIDDVRKNAIVPYLDAEITQAEAFDHSVNSIRNFMFGQVARTDLILFGRLSGDLGPDPESGEEREWKTYGDIDTLTLIPAFVTTELKRGFYMGFLLYLPFLVIDLIVATVLISMGMLVLPPILISLPFKLLLFVLVDGWTLVVRSLVSSFNPAIPPPG